MKDLISPSLIPPSLHGMQVESGSGSRKLVWGTALCLGLLFAAATPGRPQEALSVANGATSAFTPFEAPGAGTGQSQGTVATCINTAGEIAGFYIDSSGVFHGFARTANGAFTSFDVVPAAGKAKGQGTVPFGIDTAGDVVGTYADANNGYHGFVRAANGAITTFSAPGANPYSHLGTAAFGINDSGTATGMYMDTNGLFHGYIRTADGTKTTVDVPGEDSAGGNTLGTRPLAINASGSIAGVFTFLQQSPTYAHLSGGFVSVYNGATTTFQIPGASTAGDSNDLSNATLTTSINAAGEVAGAYPAASGVSRGFVRAANGTVDPFDAPGAGAGTGAFQGTLGVSINSGGVVAGTFSDSDGVMHGFVRAANGTVSAFDAPGAGVTGRIAGTAAFAINAAGTVAGAYSDPNLVYHGFVFNSATLVATTAMQTSSLASSVFGEPVTFTAKISSGGGVPPSGESVLFMNGATLLGTATLSGGTASFTTTALPVGTSSIKAVYAGDLNFAGSISAAVIEKVAKAKSFTTLTAKPNPSAFRQSVAFTATVTGQYGGTATGTATFYASNPLTALTETLGTAPLVGGAAKFTIATLPLGTTLITASYGGDSRFDSSTSEAVKQTIGKAATATTLTSSRNPSAFGESVTLTATVTGKFGGTPANSVTFFRGSAKLGTVDPIGGSAKFTTVALPVGSGAITAVFAGGANYAGSTSEPVTQVVGKASTFATLTSTPNPSQAGQSVTVTVTVKGEFGGVPTGTVSFSDGKTALKTVSLSGGVAKFSTTALAAGINTVTAVYAGNADFSGSSGSLTQTVN
jgi:hypothetical protein